MENTEKLSLEQIRAFLQASQEVRFEARSAGSAGAALLRPALKLKAFLKGETHQVECVGKLEAVVMRLPYLSKISNQKEPAGSLHSHRPRLNTR